MKEFKDLPELIPDEKQGEGSAAPNPRVKATFSWGKIIWAVLMNLFFWGGVILLFVGLTSSFPIIGLGIAAMALGAGMLFLGVWWENRTDN